jgi:hypothetical protein
MLALFLSIPSCSDDQAGPETPATPPLEVAAETEAFPDNPESPDVPAATVALEESAAIASLLSTPVATITPAEVTAVLAPGESIAESKLVNLPPGVLPPAADIMFALDLTGSMGGELNNVKVNSINIMNAIRAAIPDSRFGATSHMDYNGSFSGCGYSATYGSGGDYPYSLDQALTGTTTDVATAINGLVLGFGNDGPENYTRVLYESYSDAANDWRDGAARILLYWQDDVPHDCNYRLDCGGSGSTGPDPGRNNIANDGDDLDLATTLQGMADNDILLVALHSGGNLSLWDCYAEKTGGDAFQIQSNGNPPPGSPDIASFVVQKIQEVFTTIDQLELQAEAGYEAWLSSPTVYTNVDLNAQENFDFDITLTVPAGTEPGIYNFEVCAVADGAVVVCQQVMIVVYDPTAGFVTGGGWIDSPADAYKPDPSLTGKANFGFVSKYKKGADTPSGNTEFQFHAASLNFHSDAYEWLLVTGNDYARFKGTGTINGGTCSESLDDFYRFHVWAGDDSPDTFRIRIWCEDAGGVETDVYDNGFDQAISGGSIVIHTK